MLQQKSPLEIAKLAGSVLIVLAAAVIMFPGFLSLAYGLLRILLMIVVAGGACLLIAKATRRMAKLRSAGQPPSVTSDTNPDSSSAS